MGLIRLVIFGFILLSLIYFLVSLYSSSVRREKLEKRWDANPPEGADAEARAEFIRKGMAEYRASFRPKLILLVYIIPTVLVIGILVVTNLN